LHPVFSKIQKMGARVVAVKDICIVIYLKYPEPKTSRTQHQSSAEKRRMLTDNVMRP